jgi:hypothetical protein
MNAATPNIATPISMTSPPAMPAGTTLGVIGTPLGGGLPYRKISSAREPSLDLASS